MSDDLRLTGEQFALAMQYLLKEDFITGNTFCRLCNQHRSSQSYWRKNGIKGAPAKMLYDLIGKEKWEEIRGATT